MNKKFVYQVGNNKKVILWCTANQISTIYSGLYSCSLGDVREFFFFFVILTLISDEFILKVEVTFFCVGGGG